MIAVDGAQSVYGRAASSPGSRSASRRMGRTRRLSRNYRNTKQILEFAWQVAQSVVADGRGDRDARAGRADQGRRPQGPVPGLSGAAHALSRSSALIARLVEDSRPGAWPRGTSPCSTRARSGTGSTPCPPAAAVEPGLLDLE